MNKKQLVTVWVGVLVVGLLAGCGNEFCGVEGETEEDEACVEEEGNRYEARHHRLYAEVYNLVEVCPENPQYHADKLLKAETAEEAAYHIIAIGLLGEETPEVREALSKAAHRFLGTAVPRGYEWPELAEQFRQKLREEPNYIVDHYPGNRGLSVFNLVVECGWRFERAGDKEGKQTAE